MSFFECTAPACDRSAGSIDLIVRPARKDLGEFSVARALPAPERQAVGPFIFFDHMGPAEFAAGQGIQVRPHPSWDRIEQAKADWRRGRFAMIEGDDEFIPLPE